MQNFHDLHQNSTSFVNGGCSNKVPRMFEAVTHTDRHHQERFMSAPNYSQNCVKGPRKTMTKKVRNPRFAFQTRSHVDVLDDGYRWRKYGQKAVKNNKFPRSYYRCTHQGCSVKKQVQRLTGDEEVVVTTYDGIHTHHVEKNTENFENILSQMSILPVHFN